MNPQQNSILRRAFHAGITIKGIDGVLELAGAALLWFVKPSAMAWWIRELCVHELSRDANDYIASHVLPISFKIANTDPTFASLYLLSHGLTKVLLVAALWRNKLWAYPVTIFVFAVFTFYQSYRYMHTRSLAMLILTIFDIVVIYFTWKEYGVQKAAIKN